MSRDPERFYALLAATGVTVLNQTPSAFRQLLAADAEDASGDPLALRYVVFGGEALDLGDAGAVGRAARRRAAGADQHVRDHRDDRARRRIGGCGGPTSPAARAA